MGIWFSSPSLQLETKRSTACQTDHAAYRQDPTNFNQTKDFLQILNRAYGEQELPYKPIANTLTYSMNKREQLSQFIMRPQHIRKLTGDTLREQVYERLDYKTYIDAFKLIKKEKNALLFKRSLR